MMESVFGLKKHFTPVKILIGILTGIFTSFIYDYSNELRNKDNAYAEVTVEEMCIPKFLNNPSIEKIEDKMDLMIVRIKNSSNTDLPINYIEISYLNEFYGISTDIDRKKYGDMFDEELYTFDSTKKEMIFKGLKILPGDTDIGIFIWGDILKMPDIIEIRSNIGIIPIIESNLFGSISYARIYLAKNMGVLLIFILMIMLFLYLRGKAI